MRQVLLVLLAAGTVLTGCGTAGDDAAAPAPTGTASPAPTTTPPPSVPTPAATPTADPAQWQCSARRLSPEPVPQPDLPEPVREMRRRIVQAAVACDLEQLSALAASAPSGFTHTFGGSDDPAEHWRREEEAGRDPLRRLVEIVDLPPARTEHGDDGQHVWPSAFAYETWESVPDPDKQALQALYSQEELEGFARFGGYAGHRVGITSDGGWLFFVAGD